MAYLTDAESQDSGNLHNVDARHAFIGLRSILQPISVAVTSRPF